MIFMILEGSRNEHVCGVFVVTKRSLVNHWLVLYMPWLHQCTGSGGGVRYGVPGNGGGCRRRGCSGSPWYTSGYYTGQHWVHHWVLHWSTLGIPLGPTLGQTPSYTGPTLGQHRVILLDTGHHCSTPVTLLDTGHHYSTLNSAKFSEILRKSWNFSKFSEILRKPWILINTDTETDAVNHETSHNPVSQRSLINWDISVRHWDISDISVKHWDISDWHGVISVGFAIFWESGSLLAVFLTVLSQPVNPCQQWLAIKNTKKPLKTSVLLKTRSKHL